MAKNIITCILSLMFLFIMVFPPSLFSQGLQEKGAREIFRRLTSVAEVSFQEENAREEIRELLPKDVKPVVDEMGNLVVVLGSGNPEIPFVAHMDEIGLEVREISQDPVEVPASRRSCQTVLSARKPTETCRSILQFPEARVAA
jgi:hypothetical protein